MSEKSKKALIWLSFARSGTNYHSDLMARLENVMSYREVFQKNGVHITNSLMPKEVFKAQLRNLSKSLLGKVVSNVRDEELIKAVHEKPIETLQCLMSYTDKEYISLKIFIDHLEFTDLLKMFSQPETYKFIFWYRNPLETFISSRKVRISKTPHLFDTTEIRPDLSIDQYKNFLLKRMGWIDFVNRYKDNFFGFFSYDELMKLSTDAERLDFIIGALKGFDIDLHLSKDPVSNENSSLVERIYSAKLVKKQDRSKNWEDKIGNAESFINDCDVIGFDYKSDFTKLDLRSLN